MCKLLQVTGNSLQPAYQDGDFVLVSKIPYLFGLARPGDVIAFKHRLYGTLIKKIVRIAPNGDEIYVMGTHDFSTDSREFGAISTTQVIGRVIWHIKTPRSSSPKP